MKINFKIALYFILIVACCTLFDWYIWLTYRSIALLEAVSLFSAVIACLSMVLLYVLKGHMENLFNQLSRLISSIIDMNSEEVFSALEDDLLSKLQSQVIKLTNILKAQNSRIKIERDEIKSLVSDISHQLKTPLANLKLYYELLQDSSISKEEYTEFSTNMQSQIQKLGFLLDSMIKMSRLEGGIINLIAEQTSLNDVCLTAIKQVYQKAKSKNIEIKFNVRKEIILNIDKNWTVEAIFNLLDNAVKYTGPGGTVVIDIMQYELFARLDIVDNGPGIDEKELNNIFKRFYRGEHTQKEEGVGLGLYLAREIVTRQNGYIKVNSKLSEGTAFSVFLPNCTYEPV